MWSPETDKNSVKNNKNAAKPKKMHWFVHIILVLLVSASREGAPTASGGNHEFWKLKEKCKANLKYIDNFGIETHGDQNRCFQNLNPHDFAFQIFPKFT